MKRLAATNSLKIPAMRTWHVTLKCWLTLTIMGCPIVGVRYNVSYLSVDVGCPWVDVAVEAAICKNINRS